ncbi:hypothetical protein GC093_18490 [Paenibacillus sp. LMG 31456]|uniref:Lipoprotein n=1 Tax=Paenibacillus foliorum TaxID=2654974 RepID=A0A972GS56_9BACL|nr:hypothetical protein [Paenibacillus foliorum]NOU95195.1 hypothetical protein [Paenibacillus foliorum]
MEQKKVGKTHHIVTLFVAAALVAAPGCSNTPANSNCVDQNNDGYCDNGSGSSSSRYYGSSGTSGGAASSTSSTPSDGSSGISKGSSAHGGIGSSGGSSSS